MSGYPIRPTWKWAFTTHRYLRCITFVDDLEGLRKHFNFERGGHSWGAGLALAYAVRFPARTTAVLHIAGTGIDPRWQYSKNRLNALSESEREEYLRLREQRDCVTGDTQEQTQNRLRALSRKTDVFDPNCVDNLPNFDAYPVSSKANEKVGADWKGYTTDKIPAIRLRSTYVCSFPSWGLRPSSQPLYRNTCLQTPSEHVYIDPSRIRTLSLGREAR